MFASYSKYVKEQFGRYFHHNLDKFALIGGKASPQFGGGMILEPAEIIVIGRASDSVLMDGKVTQIPVRALCRKAIFDTLKKTFRNLDMETNVVVDAKTKSGSIDLTGVFNQRSFWRRIDSLSK